MTCGAKHTIFNTLAVTLEPGHEVITPAPYWVFYPDMTLACDGAPVTVATSEDDGFCLTAELLEAASEHEMARAELTNQPDGGSVQR